MRLPRGESGFRFDRAVERGYRFGQRFRGGCFAAEPRKPPHFDLISMNLFQALFKSSIGKKALMAATGLILVAYVIGHLVGNLQIFSEPEKINAYGHFLQTLGPALWAVRLVLLATIGLHIWAAVQLTLENRAARGGRYEKKKMQRASYASRTMIWSGLIVLAFLVYHILHFTVRSTHGEGFYPTVELAGEQVPDIHSMLILGFREPLVAGFYLLGVGLLSWHMNHGFASMFQSIGLRSRAWSGFLDKFSIVFSIAYFLGNAAIVLAAYTGYVEIQNPQVQVALAEPCMTDCQICGQLASAKN